MPVDGGLLCTPDGDLFDHDHSHASRPLNKSTVASGYCSPIVTRIHPLYDENPLKEPYSNSYRACKGP